MLFAPNDFCLALLFEDGFEEGCWLPVYVEQYVQETASYTVRFKREHLSALRFLESTEVQQIVPETHVKENSLTSSVEYCRCFLAFDDDARFSATAR